MRLSRDAWLLAAILVVFGIAVFYVGIRSPSEADSPSSRSALKRGTKAFYLLLDDLGFRVARYAGPLDAIPPDSRMLFLVDPWQIEPADAGALARWTKKGNVLVLFAGSPLAVAEQFDIGVDWRFIRTAATVTPEPGRYAAGVERVAVESSLTVIDSAGVMPIIEDDRGAVAAERALGKGRVIVFGDAGMIANSRIGDEDNSVLLSNLVYEHIKRGERVLFAEHRRDIWARSDRRPAVLGTAGKLALAHIAFTTLLVLISAGRRFGAVHPLPEAEEQRRGWEFVRAMAGIYRRAEARDVALTAIYRSFRREMLMRFGVPQAARAAEAAETVLRAAPIDRARLTALLIRCDEIAAGRKVSDGEAVALARTIEDFRRELEIARSTDG